MMHKG